MLRTGSRSPNIVVAMKRPPVLALISFYVAIRIILLPSPTRWNSP